MAEHKIDFNRGSDSNDGISAPWKNISKLASATALTSGDSVLLADDSEWNLTAHTTVNSGWTGTRGAPITIGKYSPLSASNSKPKITYARSIAANEWTYDAGSNAWYMQWHASLNVGTDSYIKLGGEWGLCQADDALPLETRDRAWKNGDTPNGGKVYVYAPAGTNPTDYYGSVEFAPQAIGVFHFNSNGGFVIVEDLSVQGGPLASLYSSSGTREFLLRRIAFDDVGSCVRQFSETSGSLILGVEDCEFSRGGAAYITTVATSGAGFGGFRATNNRFMGGGIALSRGNIYLQARGNGVSYVASNRFDGPTWGAGFTPLDGCAVYAEVGASNVVVVGNIVRNAFCAFQDNTGRSTTWMGNIAIDCNAMMKCTDVEAVGAADHRFYNNSGIRLGAPVETLSGHTVGGIGWHSYEDLACDLRNNLFTKHPDAPANPAIEVGTSATGTIANNAAYGFSTLVETYQGAASPITATGTVTSDPLLDSSYRPTANSPCIGAGTYLANARHFGGKRMSPVSPVIGAHGYYAARDVVTRAV